MGKTLRIDGQKGVIAIFTEGTSLNLLDNPNSYLNKLNFHTSLPYVRERATITTTVSFSAVVHSTIEWDDSSKGCGGCCWVMLEARYGNGTMDNVVRKYRDEFMTVRNRRGYYKFAEVIIPLMRKYKTVQKLMEWTFGDPLVKYGSWYYGDNKWGWIFTPVKSFWMGLFNVLGQETEFIRENGEVV